MDEVRHLSLKNKPISKQFRAGFPGIPVQFPGYFWGVFIPVIFSGDGGGYNNNNNNNNNIVIKV
jgi:hypothetical protein